MKIVFGIPMTDTIPSLFVGCYGSILLFLRDQGHEVSQAISMRMPLDKAREDILRQAMHSDNDYLFWIDSDVLLDAKGANTLISYLEKNQDVTVVTGMYQKKDPPFGPTAFVWSEKAGNYAPAHPIDHRPIAVAAAGMGCMLIRLKDLREKLSYPKDKPYFWFDDSGEDINFCKQMRDAGMKIVLLPAVNPAHVGGVVTGEIYRKLRGSVELE